MPIGELFINKVDAFTTEPASQGQAYGWGMSMEETALSALMTPAPMKALVENKYRSLHGKEVINNVPRYDERELTLAVHINAKTREQFLSRYQRFCDEVLATGSVVIRTKYQPNVYYKCNYISCTQFSEFNTTYAAFSLKLNEPNPNDRTKPSDWPNNV